MTIGISISLPPRARTSEAVGPHSDEAITERVKAHKEIKDNIRERRRMASTLRRAGLPGSDPFAGDVTKALARRIA